MTIEELYKENDKLYADNLKLANRLQDTENEKDGAYLERNRVVAALAACYPSGIKKTAIEGWDPEWHNCVFIDTPWGQCSWHYHDSQAYLFDHLPPYEKEWDGHSTEEKYRRVRGVSLMKGITCGIFFDASYGEIQKEISQLRFALKASEQTVVKLAREAKQNEEIIEEQEETIRKLMADVDVLTLYKEGHP